LDESNTIVLQALPTIAPAFTLIHNGAHEAPREVTWDQGAIQIKAGRGCGDMSCDGE
jgi:hypothetical protein